MRLSSPVESCIISATSLNASATLPAMPVQPTGKRALKLPCLRPTRAERICSASNRPLASPLLVPPLARGALRGPAAGPSGGVTGGVGVRRATGLALNWLRDAPELRLEVVSFFIGAFGHRRPGAGSWPVVDHG